MLEGFPPIRIIPVMLSNTEQEELNGCDLQHLYEQCLAQMTADADLTPEQKQELLLQLQLSDEDWEPIKLAEGVEPISETIIKMRRGNNP